MSIIFTKLGKTEPFNEVIDSEAVNPRTSATFQRVDVASVMLRRCFGKLSVSGCPELDCDGPTICQQTSAQRKKTIFFLLADGMQEKSGIDDSR